MSLTFDAENHKYFYQEAEVPGVSEVLRVTGQSKDWNQVPEYYRERGEAVHLAIKYHLEGCLDEDGLDPVIKPYLSQFKGFLVNIGGSRKDFLVEAPLYSKALEYAGTPDLIAAKTIWDYKCSKKIDKDSTWQYRLQGSGYRTLVRENEIGDYEFKLVLLTGEAEPAKIMEMNCPYSAWESTMSLYNLKTDRISFTEARNTK